MEVTSPSTEVPWGPINNGIRLQIWTPKMQYDWGEDVWLHLAIENCTESDLIIRSTSSFQNNDHQSPLYSLSFLRVRHHWRANYQTWDLYPVMSNKYRLHEFTRLEPGGILEEKSLLNSGLWSPDKGAASTYPLPVGECLVQALIEVNVSNDPMLSAKQDKLNALPAPLWQGSNFSNKWAVSVRPSIR